MSDSHRIRVEGGAVEVELPAGWEVEEDEEGGVLLLAPDGPGLLHLAHFPQPEGEVPDPGEELYAFLEDQGVELEDDEVEDLELAGGAELALCEYLTEQDDAGDEDEEPATYWLIAVATGPGSLVFCNYSCPAGEQGEERETVRRLLSHLRLGAAS